jgi:hypothetical protein
MTRLQNVSAKAVQIRVVRRSRARQIDKDQNRGSGEHARYDQPQPVLIVNDVKTGATGKGGVALWFEPGTVAHFRNLVVAPDTEAPR